MLVRKIIFSIFFASIFCINTLSYAQTPPPGAGIIEEKMREEIGIGEEPFFEEEPLPSEIEDIRPAPSALTPAEVPGKVYIKKFILKGVTKFDPEDFVSFLARYQNEELGIAEFNEIADGIRNFYRSKGYITTLAYIPVQQIKDNTVEIRVIEGHIGQIKVEGAKYFDKERLKNKFDIKEGDMIQYKDLVKNLKRLNTHPDRTVRAILTPGEALETTDVVLKVDDRNPKHVFVEYNNFGTRYTGKKISTLGYVDNNIFGRDDIFSLRLQKSTEDLYGGSMDYNVPINIKGTRLGGYASYVREKIGKEFKVLDAEGRALSGGIYLIQPLANRDNYQSNLSLGFDIKRNKNYILNSVTSNDKLSIVKVGLSMDWQDKFGRTFLSNEVYAGIPYFAGALGRNDPEASRFDAGGDFVKSKMHIARRQNLPWSSYLLISGKGQYTPDRLVSSEQFYIGGAETVRGYPELEHMGDYGYHFTGEIRTPAFIFPAGLKLPKDDKPLREAVQFVYFCDYGQSFLRDPLVGEKKVKSLLGAGAGIRLNLWKNFYLRADYAVPLNPKPSDGADSKIHIWAHLDLI